VAVAVAVIGRFGTIAKVLVSWTVADAVQVTWVFRAQVPAQVIDWPLSTRYVKCWIVYR
jgi:hypothetical protein